MSKTHASTARIADRLAGAQRRRFIGRQDEVALLRTALAAPEPPFNVLHVHGPGGVGKSVLLGEFGRQAEEVGARVVRLDGRTLEPSPPGWLLAWRQALGLADDPAGTAWPSGDARLLVLIDTYELLVGLDRWLRDSFLPQLPAASIVVIAGRDRPDPAWRTDVAWAALTRVVALGNLPPADSATYLHARGVPLAHHAAVLAFTHGHPLALALTADALERGEAPSTFDPRRPDVIRLLVEQLVRDIPSPQHQLALEVCAVAAVTTEAMLSELIDAEVGPRLFDWLAQLSCVEAGPWGLVPHDLARDALDAEARWRDFDAYQRLGRRVYRYLRRRIARVGVAEQQRLQLEALYAVRVMPSNQDYFDWDVTAGVYAEPATSADAPAIIAMVLRHEGEESARIAAHWLARQPRAFHVFRTAAGERFGFMAHLALHEATVDDLALDPAAAAAHGFMARYGPARAGEAVWQLRYWMHLYRYQAITAAINLAAGNVVSACVSHPRLAWNLVAMADPDFWAAHFHGINWPRAAEADFEVGERRYGVFAHDWRVELTSEWMTGEHHTPMPHAVPDHAAPVTVLAEVAFVDAVRQALRDYHRPDRLVANPLVRTRVVRVAVTGDAAAATVRELLRAAMASLAADPKARNFYRALWHTYIEPAPTQEQAAELLDLPFNTYRYHLSQGSARVAAWLWQREVAGDGDS